MINKDFNSIIELLQTFSKEEDCIHHLEQLRWQDKIISPFDATSRVYKCSNHRYRCRKTGKYFNVKTQTLFDSTKVPLQKWFLAIWIATSHKKGISSLQLAKDIDVTQKTAWFMLQRIRKCFGIENNNDLDGDVEVDETYIGGKNKNRHFDKKVKNSQGRSFKDKTAVVGMLERQGKLNAYKIPDVTSHTLTKEVIKVVRNTANLYTDEWLGYKDINKLYHHNIVKHGQHQYVIGKVHTNTLEGFWSLLKRGIIGIYHLISSKHLQKYVDEFVFRYNTRTLEEKERFSLLLTNIEFRTTYKELVNE